MNSNFFTRSFDLSWHSLTYFVLEMTRNMRFQCRVRFNQKGFGMFTFELFVIGWTLENSFTKIIYGVKNFSSGVKNFWPQIEVKSIIKWTSMDKIQERMIRSSTCPHLGFFGKVFYPPRGEKTSHHQNSFLIELESIQWKMTCIDPFLSSSKRK